MDRLSVVTPPTPRAFGSARRSPRRNQRATHAASWNAFKARFGYTPDGNAALAYDATMLLVHAVQKAGARSRPDSRLPRDNRDRVTRTGA